jgi:hypothetical protein
MAHLKVREGESNNGDHAGGRGRRGGCGGSCADRDHNLIPTKMECAAPRPTTTTGFVANLATKPRIASPKGRRLPKPIWWKKMKAGYSSPKQFKFEPLSLPL